MVLKHADLLAPRIIEAFFVDPTLIPRRKSEVVPFSGSAPAMPCPGQFGSDLANERPQRPRTASFLSLHASSWSSVRPSWLSFPSWT